MTTTSPPGTAAGARRYGAHLSLSRWQSALLVLGPPVAMVVLQVVLFWAVGLVDPGSDQAEAVTPLQLLAVNVSMSVTGLVTVPLVARAAGVGWRTILSHPRGFDRRRLGVYGLWALGATVLGNLVLGIAAPETTPWVGFGVSATTLALVAVLLLTTPFTAAAEELVFRGAAMPAVAAWVRPERWALAVGVLVSSLTFAATHFSSDPWLFGYHFYLGVATAAMAILSRGLEAPIAFHVANNTLTAVVNALLAGGGDFSVERTAGAGGPHLIVPAALVLALVVVVGVRERRVDDLRSP